jgi:hypothetical protein
VTHDIPVQNSRFQPQIIADLRPNSCGVARQTYVGASGGLRKVLDHANIACADPDEAMPELFAFVSDAGDDPPSYSSGKRGKCKVGHSCKWIGEKGMGEFLW